MGGHKPSQSNPQHPLPSNFLHNFPHVIVTLYRGEGCWRIEKIHFDNWCRKLEVNKPWSEKSWPLLDENHRMLTQFSRRKSQNKLLDFTIISNSWTASWDITKPFGCNPANAHNFIPRPEVSTTTLSLQLKTIYSPLLSTLN